MNTPRHGAVAVYNEPCPWCAVWIGPHRHWLREDGSLGLIVEEIEPPKHLDTRDVLADLPLIEGRG